MLLRRSVRHLSLLKFPSHPNVNLIGRKNLLRTGLLTIRHFSDSSNSNSDIANTAISPFPPESSFEDVSTDIATNLADSGVVEATTDALLQQAVWTPAVKVIYCIDYVHNYLAIPYWESIILVSLGVRFCLVPIAILTAQSAARMAVIRPILMKLQKAHAENLNAASDPRQAKQFQMEMTALFVKHKVNPLLSILFPFLQIPIFLSFFTALKEMGTYYPGFLTGGAYWFTNLAVADATLILPFLNGLSFLLLVELGANDIPKSDQKDNFKLGMRCLAIAMVPFSMTMPQALLVYWNFNNLFSMAQSMVFRTNWFKKSFNIPPPPKDEDTQVVEMKNPFKMMADHFNKAYEEAVEKAKPVIVESSSESSPPPPPSSVASSNGGSDMNNGIIHTKAATTDVMKGLPLTAPVPPQASAVPTIENNESSSTPSSKPTIATSSSNSSSSNSGNSSSSHSTTDTNSK